MAEVVNFKKKPKYSQRIRNAEDAMEKLRWEMHMWKPKDLAEECGVSVATIYGIRCGRTKWPRPKTFFTLIDVLDLEMYLVKK